MLNYSIIIPHKNVPHLLVRCLNSIPYRNDIEVIVIDDCSDRGVDRLSELIESTKNEYIHYILLTESHGAGYARNKGLECAKGKWLLFADADDFYTDKLSEILDGYVLDDSTDVVYLNAQIYRDNGSVQEMSFTRYIDRYNKHKFYSEKVLRYNMWTPWTRMVRRSLVEDNGLRFEEVPVGNDKIFCLNCSRFANRIRAEHTIVYNYYMPEEGSLTYKYCLVPENLRIKLELQLRTNSVYKDVGYFFMSSLLYFYLSSASYQKNKEARTLYRSFFKEHSLSYFVDFVELSKQVVGKLLGIL